jgi:hypothetical protein
MFDVKKIYVIACIFVLTSCQHEEHSKKYNSINNLIERTQSTFVYNHLRFVGIKHSINEKLPYDYFTMNCIVVKNSDIDADKCELDITLDSSYFYYVNCHFNCFSYKAEDKTIKTDTICLRFDELEDEASFPHDISIKFNILNPMIVFDDDSMVFNKLLIWAPKLNMTSNFENIHYNVQIHFWDGYKSENEDFNTWRKIRNNVPYTFESNWKDDCYEFDSTINTVSVAITDEPESETYFSDATFLVS